MNECLRWFTGKKLEAATAAVEAVKASLDQGCWLPGWSRKARAALDKANVAAKIAKANERWMEHDFDRPTHKRTFDIFMAMFFGCFCSGRALQKIDFDALKRACRAEERPVIDQAAQYSKDFSAIVAAVNLLDATAPKPVFTTMNASPTISKNIQDLGAVKVEVCPSRLERYEVVDKKGNVQYRWRVILLWPEGTVHGTSRYRGTLYNMQCEACGHAIKNRGNWVPLVLTSKDGTPKSLWVGRDCSKTLFGIDFTGDLEIVGEEA